MRRFDSNLLKIYGLSMTTSLINILYFFLPSLGICQFISKSKTSNWKEVYLSYTKQNVSQFKYTFKQSIHIILHSKHLQTSKNIEHPLVNRGHSGPDNVFPPKCELTYKIRLPYFLYPAIFISLPQRISTQEAGNIWWFNNERKNGRIWM